MREPEAAYAELNYPALIRAYNIIKEYATMEPGVAEEEMKERFEEWRNSKIYAIEKSIAEMVVKEEMLYNICFGSEINDMAEFEPIPAEPQLEVVG